MDTATLAMATAAIEMGSVRAAARRLDRPVATVAAALDRLEADLALSLVGRAGNGLAVTLEARRILPRLTHLRDLCESLAEPSADRAARTARTGLSVEALRRFVDVVKAGSIRKAAQRLGMGQPQLTRQIGRMERVLAVRLLDRRPEGCTETAAGARVAALAREIDAVYTELAASARGQFARDLHTVRLGSIVPLGHESHIARILAAVVAAWSARGRGDHVTVTSATADDLIAGMKAGRLDLALLDIDGEAVGLPGERLATSPLGLVGPSGFAAGRTPRAILAAERVALPTLRSGLRQTVGQMIGGPGGLESRTPANFVEVDSIPVIVNLVIRHRFVSVLPLASIAALKGAFDVVPLDRAFDLPLWLVWRPSERGRTLGLSVADLIRTAL